MDAAFIDRVVSCTALPRLPTVVTKLIEVIESPNVNAEAVANTVSQDPDLALNLLRKVNSSYYGLSSTVSSVKQAVVMLGMKEVKHIAIGCALSGTMSQTSKTLANATIFWRHALFCASACKLIAKELKETRAEESFLTGLLVNIGSLAMMSALGDEYDRIVRQKWNSMTDLARLELKALEGDHAEVSAAIAESWQLPAILVEPMRFAYHPGEAAEQYSQMAKILFTASNAADLIMIAQSGDVDRFFNASKDFCDEASRMLNLNWQTADQLLHDVGEQASELSELFTIDTGEIPSFEDFGDDFNLVVKSNPAA